MPELPDIEVFCRLVQRDCIGLTVSNIDVLDAACLVATTPASMVRRLKLHTLDSAARHGKVLFLGFGGAGVLAMHFGPAGSLWVVVGDAALPAYVRLRMDLSGGSRIAFVDRRRIGRVQLVASFAAPVAESESPTGPMPKCVMRQPPRSRKRSSGMCKSRDVTHKRSSSALRG